ncbi:MAG TPA: hypothetical protein VM598_12220, partial [Bdellovibrionota bacterium]|nr:hypothetical protein [Bdellovibrionota bacterium]
MHPGSRFLHLQLVVSLLLFGGSSTHAADPELCIRTGTETWLRLLAFSRSVLRTSDVVRELSEGETYLVRGADERLYVIRVPSSQHRAGFETFATH